MSGFIEGQRYLVMTFGSAHVDGVFVRVGEMGPGHAYIEMTKTKQVGQTGQLGVRHQNGKSSGNDSTRDPRWVDAEDLGDRTVCIPWHNVDRWFAIGD